MTDQLPHLLARCAVRIVCGRATGTGFFVAPNVVATCAHVLRAGVDGAVPPIEVRWGPATGSATTVPAAVVGRWDADDVALLRVEIDGHPCVAVNADCRLGDSLFAYVYADARRGAGDSVRGQYEGETEYPNGVSVHYLLKISGAQVQPGMSGAPLLNLRTGAVCGMVSESRDSSSALGGRAVPAAALEALAPEIVADGASFHDWDGRWREARDADRREMGAMTGTWPGTLTGALTGAPTAALTPESVREVLAWLAAGGATHAGNLVLAAGRTGTPAAPTAALGVAPDPGAAPASLVSTSPDPGSAATQQLTIIQGLYDEARAHLVAGRLDGARTIFEPLLGRMDTTPAAPATDAWRGFRQAILLSLAQVEIREGNADSARARLAAARAAGVPFAGRRRLLAGWVLLNLRHADEAREVLSQESDGSEAWRNLLAVAQLVAGDYAGFSRDHPREADVDDGDVLSALVRYHAECGEYASAAEAARRLLAAERCNAGDWVHPVEATGVLLSRYAYDGAAPRDALDAAWLVGALRTLLAETAPGSAVLESAGARERALIAFWRARFHQVLLESDRLVAALAELSATDPDETARLLAAGPAEVPADVLETARGAADPGDAAVLAAYAAADRGDFAAGLAALATALEIARETAQDDPDSTGPARAEANGAPDDARAIRERLLGVQVELLAASGAPEATWRPTLEAVRDPVTRSTLEAVVAMNERRDGDALEHVANTLDAAPRDLRALRNGFDIVLAAHRRTEEEPAAETSTAAGLADRAGALLVRIGRSLVDRLPCPEHELRLAVALERAGDPEEAYRVVRGVEQEGYRTRRTAGLVVVLAYRLRRFRQYAAAAAALVDDFGADGESVLRAGRACYVAGDLDAAERLLRRAAGDDDAVIAGRALVGLAQILDERAAAAGDRSAPGVTALLEAYTRRRDPELASALAFRSLGTPREGEVAALIGRDYGSLAALPGWRAVTSDEVVAMLQRRHEASATHLRLWEAGAVPFRAFANLAGGPGLLTWEVARRARALVLTEPPTIRQTPLRRAAPVAPASDLPGILLHETALYTLAEEGLLATAFAGFRCVLLRSTFDRVADETTAMRVPGDTERGDAARELRHQTAALAVADGRLAPEAEAERSALAAAGVGADAALELAVAARDDGYLVDDTTDRELVPPEARYRLLLSADVVGALIRDLGQPFGLAARAHEADPDRFPAAIVALDGAGPRTDRPLILDADVVGAWARAGALDALVAWPGGVRLSPAADASIQAEDSRAATDEAARQTANALLAALVDAVESGTLAIHPDDPGEGPPLAAEADSANGATSADRTGEEPGAGSGARAPEGNAFDNVAEADAGGSDPAAMVLRAARSAADPALDVLATLRRLTADVEAHYHVARARGVPLWADDGALHLYLDHAGPYALEVEAVRRRRDQLVADYGGVEVIGTGEALRRLAARGALDSGRRAAAIGRLSRDGRWMPLDAEVLASAALAVVADDTDNAGPPAPSSDGSDGGAVEPDRPAPADVLAALSAARSALSGEAAARSAVRVAYVVADAACRVLGSTPTSPVANLDDADGNHGDVPGDEPADERAGARVDREAAVPETADSGLGNAQSTGAGCMPPDGAPSVPAAPTATTGRGLDEAARRRAVTLLLEAFRPWASRAFWAGRVAAGAFWSRLALRLCQDATLAPGDVTEPVVEEAARPGHNDWLWRGAWDGVSTLVALAEGLASFPNRATAVLSAHIDAAGVPGPDGTSLYPERALRMAAACLALHVEGSVEGQEAFASRTAEGVEVRKTATYALGTSQLEVAALDALNAAIAVGAPLPPDVAASAHVVLRAKEPDGPAARAGGPVDRVLLLFRATPSQRAALLPLVAAEFDASGATDLAAATRAHTPGISDPDLNVAWSALAEYYRALLASPRIWEPLDSLRTAEATRRESYADLRTAAGSPPVWLDGEDVLRRIARLVRTGVPDASVGRTWRGSALAAEALVAQLAPVAERLGAGPELGNEGAERSLAASAEVASDASPEPAAGSPDPAGALEAVARRTSGLLGAALLDADPFQSALRLVTALGALQLAPELADVGFDPSAVGGAGEGCVPLAGVRLGDLAAWALEDRLTLDRDRRQARPESDDITNELGAEPVLDTSGTTEADRPSARRARARGQARALAAAGAEFATLHAAVARLVHAATLTVEHLDEAGLVLSAPEADDGSDTSDGTGGGANPTVDLIGDVLHVGRLLADRAFAGAIQDAGRRAGTEEVSAAGGAVALSEELDAAARQLPFARFRRPAEELFVPDLLGTDNARLDPYLATLLAMLERLVARTTPDATEPAEVPEAEIATGSTEAASNLSLAVAPPWSTPGVREALRALADREPTPGERLLADLAATPDVADRFTVAWRVPRWVRARNVLRNLSEPPRSDSAARAAPEGGG